MEFNYPEIEEIRKKIAAASADTAPEVISPEEGGDLPDDKTPFNSPFLKGVATFLSWVMVPLLMPVYGMLIILYLSVLSYVASEAKTMVLLVLAGLNALLPMCIIYSLKLTGIIRDVALNGRRERLIPYIITIVGYGLSVFYLSAHGAPHWVGMLYLGAVVTAFINLLVNFKWKISAHAAGIAGIVAMVFVIAAKGAPQHDPIWWMAGTMMAAGLLGSARIYLGRHTLMQILAGFVTGFLPVFVFGMYI